LHQLFQDATNRADLDAMIGLYEPNPAFATHRGAESGTDALRTHLTDLLAMRPRFERVTTTKVFEASGIALTCSDWIATATDPAGTPMTMTGRGTEVARQQRDGTWLLVIDDPWGTA
jgi:ketosteroid isomerase-like protein